MTTLGHHHLYGSRTCTGLALFIGAPLLVLAIGWWVFAKWTGDAPSAVLGDGVAPLQTLIFMHRGDVPAPIQAQPQS
jgi:hypothetical protein